MGIAEWLARLFARPAGAADITDVEVGVTATCWECSLCGRAFESVYGPTSSARTAARGSTSS